MIITYRTKEGQLRSKDVLDMTIDMSVKKDDGKYYVVVTGSGGYIDKPYDSEADAEKVIYDLTDKINNAEMLLKNNSIINYGPCINMDGLPKNKM